MKMKLLSMLLILVSAFAVSPSPVSANELASREEIKDTVVYLVLERDFSALEEMAADFRENDARTSSGLRKLHIFYIGFERAVRFSFRIESRSHQLALEIMEEWV